MKLPAVLTKAFTLLRWSVAEDAMARAGVRRSSARLLRVYPLSVTPARVRACVLAAAAVCARRGDPLR